MIKVKEWKSGSNKKLKRYNTMSKLEEKKISIDDRKLALAQFLGIEKSDYLSEIEEGYDDTYFEYGGEEYHVLTDEEADDAFYEYEKDLIDEMGLDSFEKDFKEWILENAITVSKTDQRLFLSDLADSVMDSPDSYIHYMEDYFDDMKKNLIKDKDFLKYLNSEFSEEIVDTGLDIKEYAQDYLDGLTDDELVSTYSEYNSLSDLADSVAEDILNEYDGNIMEYILDQGFYSGVDEAIENMNIFDLDWDMVIDQVKYLDGRGGSLAGYDGEENDEKVNGTYFYIYRTY